MRVAIIGRAEPGYYTAPKKYFVPFSGEAVEKAMRDTLPPTTERNMYGKISLILVREGTGNNISAPDLETFINADFDTLWKKSMQPAPQLNIDTKDLAAYLKLDAASKSRNQYQ